MTLFNKQIFIYVGLLLTAEILSLTAYFFPILNIPIFFIIVIGFLILSSYKLQYGLLIALGEIFIGSKGYLLALNVVGLSLSIRIAFWLIIMSIWAGGLISKLIKDKKIKIGFICRENRHFFLLAIFILWGFINGLINDNGFSNIFFDFNAWLFFLYILPISEYNHDKKFIYSIFSLLSASVIWLSLKTLALIFIFTHFNPESILGLYRWVRDTGVGEITRMESGFYRIFIQSQIFSLIMIFVWLWQFMLKPIAIMKDIKYWLLFMLLISSAFLNILSSYSRSFWVGAAVSSFAFIILAISRKIKFKSILNAIVIGLFSLATTLLIMFITVKFPYPQPSADFNAKDLAERAGTISGEAGASSRWSLLPKLQNEIESSIILGQGFGKTVTYNSSDPRILQSSANGEYTTYAFEWGWLDIWLKLGIFGLLSYLYLIYSLISYAIKKKNDILDPLAIGLLAIVATSFFSPYTNHPLGITFIIILSLYINTKDNWLKLNNLLDF